MNEQELKCWLENRWEEVISSFVSHPDEEIDRFINSTVLSIRYAILTQLLGKLADPSRDLLCLQRGSKDPSVWPAGRWDPRGFCTRIVVPWNQSQYSVLGTSDDPYVNNPLRRPRLDEGMESLKYRKEWCALVGFLSKLEDASDPAMVRNAVIGCLQSIARRLREQQVDYPVPVRIGMDQLGELIEQYLAVSSGGLRPMVVATALMRTLGKAYTIFARVESQGVNEADSATGVPGDVLCYDEEDDLALAVEVKGHELTLIEVESTILKARSSRVTNVLFATPGLASADRDAIEEKIIEEFAKGGNVFQASIQSLVRTSFVLLKEEWRVNFLRAICSELDARSSQPSDRIAFATLLST